MADMVNADCVHIRWLWMLCAPSWSRLMHRPRVDLRASEIYYENFDMLCVFVSNKINAQC